MKSSKCAKYSLAIRASIALSRFVIAPSWYWLPLNSFSSASSWWSVKPASFTLAEYLSGSLARFLTAAFTDAFFSGGGGGGGCGSAGGRFLRLGRPPPFTLPAAGFRRFLSSSYSSGDSSSSASLPAALPDLRAPAAPLGFDGGGGFAEERAQRDVEVGVGMLPARARRRDREEQHAPVRRRRRRPPSSPSASSSSSSYRPGVKR